MIPTDGLRHQDSLEDGVGVTVSQAQAEVDLILIVELVGLKSERIGAVFHFRIRCSAMKRKSAKMGRGMTQRRAANRAGED